MSVRDREKHRDELNSAPLRHCHSDALWQAVMDLSIQRALTDKSYDRRKTAALELEKLGEPAESPCPTRCDD